MSEASFQRLEDRLVLSFDLPGGIDPGQINIFDGVRIDARNFPASPVTVQVTNTGPVVQLPILRNGIVTGSATGGIDTVSIEQRTGVDAGSDLPAIIYLDGVESTTAGVGIYGNLRDGVEAFDDIVASLGQALGSLNQTRQILISMGADTTAIDQQIQALTQGLASVQNSINAALTSPFVRVTVNGQFDSYFLASEVQDVRIDTGSGDDIVNSTMSFSKRLIISGGDGNDLVTSTGRTTLVGGAGNDRLVAGSASLLDGGAGNDTLIGSPQSDTMLGGGGKDVYVTSNNLPGVVDVINPRQILSRLENRRERLADLLA